MSEDVREMEVGETGFQSIPSVGAQLQAAREARGMSVADVAQILKLGPRQVVSLENGDWQGLPGITFVRGFVRNYARLVQIDATSLMAQLDQVLDAPKPQLDLPETTPATMPAGGRGQKRDYAVALFGLGLVVLALVVHQFMPGGMVDLQASLKAMGDIFARQESAAPAPALPQPEPVLPPGATTQQVLNPQAIPAPEGVPTVLPPVAPAPVATPAQLTQAADATPHVLAPAAPPVLRLVFEKESWVEVRDRSNKILYSQKGTAGSDQAVEGEAPFALIVGYAPGVRVFLRGQAVDLQPYSRGDVARLTLD